MENKIGQYRTKDLYIAALLYARGVSLIGIDREGGRCWFIFGEGDMCEQVQADYWSRKVQVNAKDMVEAIRSLKDMIFINN